MGNRPTNAIPPTEATEEPSLLDMPGRPSKTDCARVIVQLDLGLAHRPDAGHPHVVREARRRLDSLLSHALTAERAMAMIRREFGAFPKPSSHDAGTAEETGHEDGIAPAPFGIRP